jgi:hypothetical protein
MFECYGFIVRDHKFGFSGFIIELLVLFEFGPNDAQKRTVVMHNPDTVI